MKAPFKTPIFVSDRTVLVADDAELICETEAAKPEELAYIVLAVNSHAELVEALREMLTHTDPLGACHWSKKARDVLAKLQGAKS